MSGELPKTYEPKAFQQEVTERWLEAGAFNAIPNADDLKADKRYVVMMPLPNVTGALHMGHAMDNVMQDMLVRWHRMQGDNTLWQPGTDHAGIATQAVVEKRLKEQEGLTRHDIGREALVERIWAWKDEFQARIIRQQQQMGCSCDRSRQRFTMDAVCSAAVREAFFKLFSDKLIFRGDRLVNWDCMLQTAVANDEVYHETIQGHFWHLRYPVIAPKAGEPEYVIVATTRPETMLGDAAVACHPRPTAAMQKKIAEVEAKLAAADSKDREALEAELERLKLRLQEKIPALEQLAAMARDGRMIQLPLMNRPIPLICDEWAKPELGSGLVKITPAHDPNDYGVWQRHQDQLEIRNILKPDGTLNALCGSYAGLERYAARDKIVADLEALGLLDHIEDHETEVGHSDRSKTIVEPYLSKQWFVRMADVEGGVNCGVGTEKAFVGAGLAQIAIDAANSGRVKFHPDSERYLRSFTSWLGEKRDWCISRQLWWGHRIPVWSCAFESLEALKAVWAKLPSEPDAMKAWISDSEGNQRDGLHLDGLSGACELQVCIRFAKDDARLGGELEKLGLMRDGDVLDTWFSSALWPFSTLGWPDCDHAPILEGQRFLGSENGQPTSLQMYYPGACLVTGRDILTLWVARMVMFGLYTQGDVPFHDVFLHTKILDGKGETMSKSRGNGVDPVDIIERYGVDAMRYVICEMQTGIQDTRMPVQADCPHCGQVVDLGRAKHGRTKDGHENKFTYCCTACKQEFDVLGTMKDMKSAKVYSDRFEVGMFTCNKLWNAARFALMNLGDLAFEPLALADLESEDRWLLSRLEAARAACQKALEDYNPANAIGAVRDFFWSEMCDWYLELVKPRLNAGSAEGASSEAQASAKKARQVLAVALDQVLRLFHPFIPFITEAIWAQLNAQAPVRGIEKPLPQSALCTKALWPEPQAWRDPALESTYAALYDAIRAVREIRARYNVAPKAELPCAIRGPESALEAVRFGARHLAHMANLSSLDLGPEAARPAHAGSGVLGELELFVGDVLDEEKERVRLMGQKVKLQKTLEATEKKLGNAGFVAKAPPEVVEAQKALLADTKAQLALLEQNLAALD